MKKQYLFLILLLSNHLFAHTIPSENQILRHWNIQNVSQNVEGSFSMYKNGNVYIEDANHLFLHFPISSFSAEDQKFIDQKTATIELLNTSFGSKNSVDLSSILYQKFGLISLFLIAFSFLLFKYKNNKKPIYLLPIVCLGSLFSLFSFTKKMVSTTDPAFMTAAFAPFTSTVSTTFDSNYFYVNSTGIPNHTMMVGISNHGWQQQVPISKCYINSNHWTIPLNPVLAANPVPVSATHFTKGAIAMATNGVPIFNYHTNTGVDSYTDGQLDNFGGHCGRGDDYHYHIAPLHLITSGQTSATLPIAFGLDGFAVYGSLEPDGLPMSTLDANHGHYGSDGVYHYHGTQTAPYMIGNMVGVVTEDASLQIIPQPQGSPVRNENWTPLNGALITACTTNATNTGYNTSYSLNGISGYATNYSLSGTIFTFKYVTPSGITTTNYNGPAACVVPNLGADKFMQIEQNISIFPNPTSDLLNINLGNNDLVNEVQNIAIYDFNSKLVLKTNQFKSKIDIKSLSSGTYFVKIQFSNSVVTKKLVIQ